MVKVESLEKEYSNFYFAFMDILGFKEIVKTKSCAEILNVFEEAKKELIVTERIEGEGNIPVIPPEDIHYYVMSDSVCIFIRDDVKSALPILSFICMHFQARMLCLNTPVLVRGSITKGKLFAENNILFGPAMVEAYLRSEKLAHVPRIIIPEDLRKSLVEIDKTLFDGVTHLESDGFFALNYMDFFYNHRSCAAFRKKVEQYVEEGLICSLDQSVREKFLYVKSWMDLYKRNEDESEE